MRLFNYKELKNTTLNKIYAEYGSEKISLLHFRSRVYMGNMTMTEALTKPLSGSCSIYSGANKYVDKLYSKLKKENPKHVTQAHFIVKMSKGFAPSIAIINKYSDRTPKKKKVPLSTKEIVLALKKQEAKETKEARKKKARPFTVKEAAYIANVSILNRAFSKVKNKEACS